MVSCESQVTGGTSQNNTSALNYYQAAAHLSVAQVACSDTNFVVLTTDGSLYSVPHVAQHDQNKELQRLHLPPGEVVSQVVSHADAKHFLAITTNMKVLTWGSCKNEGGWLGMGDREPYPKPVRLPYLSSITKVAVGSTHSAAVSAKGELYTWGRGHYGRLGHGDHQDQLKPKLVAALKTMRVVDVACGSGDAQSLAVTADGTVYGWGDGDYGKLGMGGCGGTPTPVRLAHLKNAGVHAVKVYCGHQFSVVLSKDGRVFTFGRGDNGRTGLGEESPLRTPTLVPGLTGYDIRYVAVGSCHVVCITNGGEVLVWGNDARGQLGGGGGSGGTVCTPSEVSVMRQVSVAGVACGPNQTILWTRSASVSVGRCVAYVVDAVPDALSRLCHVLTRCGGSLLDSRVVPHQEQECLVVSTLNLLRLQFASAVENDLTGADIGIGVGSDLLGNLKQAVISLATTPGVLPTIQKAAQGALQCGWVYLLPTSEERTAALSDLLPTSPTQSEVPSFSSDKAGPATGGGASGSEGGAPGSSGRRFMLDLLVASLMADGGLEMAVDQGIAYEVEQEENSDRTKKSTSNPGIGVSENLNGTGGLPLLHLLSQLLLNVSSQTNFRLQSMASMRASEAALLQILPGLPSHTDNDCCSCYGEECSCGPAPQTDDPSETPASVQLLLRFQRILVCRLVDVECVTDRGSFAYKNSKSEGCGLLLRKYLQLLVTLVSETLNLATTLLKANPSLLPLLYRTLAKDVTGLLVGELCLSLLVVCHHMPKVAVKCGLLQPLMDLLIPLDEFNRAAPYALRLDHKNLAWPGVFQAPSADSADKLPALPLLRKEDIENHNREGGHWIVMDGKVYDMMLFKYVLFYHDACCNCRFP